MWLRLLGRWLGIVTTEIEHRQKERQWRAARVAIDLADQRQRELAREIAQREWEQAGGKKWTPGVDINEEER